MELVETHSPVKVCNLSENYLVWKYHKVKFLQDPGGRANQLEGENARQVNPPCGSRWQSAMEGPRWPPLFRNIQGRSTWAGKVIYFSPKIKKPSPVGFLWRWSQTQEE